MNKSNIPALTSIRGVAALAVVFTHINQTYPNLFFFSFFKNGDLGVDLFFVLSGFILAYVYNNHQTVNNEFGSFYHRFIIARLARIYPLHGVTLLFTLILVLFLPGFSERYSPDFFSEGSFFANVFLIQNWGGWGLSWNNVSWSLSAEWFMYLLFPFMLFAINFVKHPVFVLIAILSVVALHHVFIFTLELDSYGGLSLGGMVRVFFEFTLGFLSFYLRHYFIQIFNICKGRLSIAFSISAISAMYFEEIWLLFLPSVTLLIIHLSIIECGLSKLLSKKHFLHLGNISFSLYMWHWLIIQLQNWAKSTQLITVDSELFVYFTCFIMTIISLIAAHYSYIYIEKPCRNWFRKKN